VQERAGRGQEEPFRAQEVQGGAAQAERLVQVRAPDVPAADQAQGQGAGLGQERADRLQLFRGPGQVQVQGPHRQVLEERRVAGHAAERGGQEDLGRERGLADPGQDPVGPVQGRGGQVRGQGRLVDLDPGAARGQVAQQGLIGPGQGLQQGPLVLARISGLGQVQEGQRPHEHGLGRQAQAPGLGQLPGQACGRGPELLVHVQLGHDVVVVRVEPLGHLHGPHARAAPGHEEHALQAAAGLAGVALGHTAQEQGQVEHLVVQAEVAHRHQLDARLGLEPPMGGAQVPGAFEQGFGVGFAPPEALHSGLELAVAADAGKSQGVREHEASSLCALGFCSYERTREPGKGERTARLL